MAITNCAILCGLLALVLVQSYKISDLEQDLVEDIEMLNEQLKDGGEISKASKRGVLSENKRNILVYTGEDGASPVAHHNQVKAKTDCPAGKVRMNLCGPHASSFVLDVNPNNNDQLCYNALDDARVCQQNDPENCEEAIATLRDNDKLTIESSDPSKVMYVRQVCGYTFTVDDVKVNFKLQGRSEGIKIRWTPVANAGWYRYGCTDNDWIETDKLAITMLHQAPSFTVKDFYAEICI